MFKKNLEYIDNLALKRRLSRMSIEESRAGISYCITPSNDYILLKDDVPSDDLNNPREAIREMLKKNIKNEMHSNDIIITFGIGLGYLLDEVFNTYPSRIFVYEPDVNFLHFVLNNVDISQHLASGRVYITNDLDELLAKLNSSFITKDRVEIVYLQNYAVSHNRDLLLLTQKVYDTCKSKMVDVNTITKFSKKWLTNTIVNIAAANNSDMYKLSDLEGKFSGQTALIAGAGPSLNDNIAHIQANRNNFIIFCVNKALKYLLQNGITPDFVVCLDATNMQKTVGDVGNQLERINCIMDIRTDYTLTNMTFNKIFMNFSNTDFLMAKLAKFNNDIKFYESGGSATILALISAIKLGFSRIVLAGLDLAFKDNIVYANGEAMNRISPEQIIIDHVKKNLVRIKSVNGARVYTREDYEVYIHHIESILKELNYKEVYNLSSFGAYIDGVKAVQFGELNLWGNSSSSPIATAEPFKLELKDFMKDEFYHINSIISLLSKEIFSPALVSSIVRSVFIYQYMQADILNVLQRNFDPTLAEEFVGKTKFAIKTVVELLQKYKLI